MEVFPKEPALLVSVAQAADMIGSSRSEVYLKIGRGQLDAVKDGGRTKIPMASIRDYVAGLPKATEIKPQPLQRKRNPVDVTATRIA